MYLTSELFPPQPRKSHETELEGLEEARETALEVAKEKDAAPKARAENGREIVPAFSG